MKLIYRLLSRISIALVVLLTAWSVIFYFVIMEEVNDETDDTLEDYSEYIITRALAGEELPSKNNGTNNSYHITEVSAEYANRHPAIRYSDESVYLENKREDEPARVLKTIFRDQHDTYYELIVSIPTIEKEDLIRTILAWIVSLYLILLLAIMVVNYWILKSNLRPLHNLLDWINKYSVGSKLIPLQNETNVTEFRKLNETILRMAQRNNELYDQQKQFVGHASHELQTPLAICQNRLEILLNDPGLNEQQMVEIIKTRQTLEQAVKLNKTLLLLTKIKSGQVPESSTINVNSLIKKLSEDFSEVYGHRNIRLNLIENSELEVDMNESLARILFSNFIKNAYVHNIDNGTIDILITDKVISISNTGDDSPLDSVAIFKPFYQGNKKEGSTGLGLAINEAITTRYGIELSYKYINGKHTFTLSIH